ncbi:hypothetical protein ABNX05_22115 [Lysinibacillus sp. M3]|uniref:Phospholipase A(2) n=1 Tax=Lysinibacillus zambalensis TaxID=3160866 RepID=A0ABV1N0H1_9BACI
MKRYNPFDFDVDSIEVLDGLKFDTLSPKQDVVTAKAIDLKINEKMGIRYITRYFNGNVEDTSDFITGYLVNETTEGDSTVIHQIIFREANDTIVSIIENSVTEEVFAANKEQESSFKEEYNYDENYYPGQLLEQINTEGVVDGCLAGGYIYCGGNCGGYPACESSVKGINALDNCCKTHDCCYKYNGVDKYPHCMCDQRLCDCSQASGVTWVDRFQVQAVMCFVYFLQTYKYLK